MIDYISLSDGGSFVYTEHHSNVGGHLGSAATIHDANWESHAPTGVHHGEHPASALARERRLTDAHATADARRECPQALMTKDTYHG